ncbi:hypothetical protein CW306_03360 [Bacillus sp. BA3]|uniref:hypothetical protein n=1 Tax=Bacillus sp. BA3 TaxID=2057910 RepID=UPI000C349F91|nr:hypothetical protein [Bacillus sp. BA3]PKF90556.1 hypothetical protein CW306_03360 [Bacillus sp. BA3]
MLHLKKIILIPIVAFGLVGCNSEEASVESEETKVVVSDEQGKAAKEEALERLETVSKERKDATEEEGYLKSEEYPSVKNGVNILANAIGSEALITMNDEDDMDEQFSMLKEDIDSLSSEELYLGMEKIDTFKNVYESAIMETIHTSMKSLDIDGYDSEMHEFNIVIDSSTPVEEINESADSYIDTLNWIKDDLESLKTESEKYGKDFSGEEVDKLYEIISGLKASAVNQIGVLSNFTKARIDTGITLEEYLEEAKDEYAEAEQAVTELEEELEVEYVEDSE